MKILVYICALLSLTACGGGSSGESNSSGGASAPTISFVPPQPDTTPSAVPMQDSVFLQDGGLYIHGSDEANTGDSVGFAVTTDDRLEIVNTRWELVSGPETSPLSTHTQILAFDALNSGTYEFTVQVDLQDDTTRQTNFELVVQDSSETLVNARLDHVASENGRVSLRLDTKPGMQVEQITWTQRQGPTPTNISFSADDRTEESSLIKPNSLFFAAPNVSYDQVIQYDIDVQFSDGTQAQEDVFVLVDNVSVSSNGFFPANDLYVTAHMQPYKDDSPYAQALLECVYNNTMTRSCSFSKLPLIGMQTSTPTIEDILDRTLVSHPWMGDRFAEYLRESVAGPDMLNLLRGTTAIVIAYDIRPSFYWGATGAIYLDANNFWRTPEERDTLNTAPDFRSSFGNALQFDVFWRYVKDGQSYLRQAFPSITARTSKSFDALEAGLSWLMYHELGHANDFFPPRRWSSISRNTTPRAYSESESPDSTSMANSYPLQSVEMDLLADVRFGGVEASQTQRNYTKDDVAQFFAPDNAPAFYAYYTIREDYATLFEHFMMLYRFDIPADIGVVGNISEPVSWAQRARINDPALRQRLSYAVERLYPELDFNAIQPSLREAEILPNGLTWNELLSAGESEQIPALVIYPDWVESSIVPVLPTKVPHQ